MSTMMFKEETITIALLYNYMATRDLILSAEKIEAFDKMVDANLEQMNIKLNTVCKFDPSKLLYFTSWDEMGNQYYILKPDFNAEKAIFDYIYQRPVAVEKSTQKENALDLLGLKLENGDIKTKEVKVRRLVK